MLLPSCSHENQELFRNTHNHCHPSCRVDPLAGIFLPGSDTPLVRFCMAIGHLDGVGTWVLPIEECKQEDTFQKVWQMDWVFCRAGVDCLPFWMVFYDQRKL